jgi:hypothetical protein
VVFVTVSVPEKNHPPAITRPSDKSTRHSGLEPLCRSPVDRPEMDRGPAAYRRHPKQSLAVRGNAVVPTRGAVSKKGLYRYKLGETRGFDCRVEKSVISGEPGARAGDDA